MNYAEIEMKGEKVGLYYSIFAISAMIEEEKKLAELEEIPSIGSMARMASILYIGYRNNCAKFSVVPKFTRADFFTYLEHFKYVEGMPNEVQKAMDAYSYAINEENEKYKPSENGVLAGEEKKN